MITTNFQEAKQEKQRLEDAVKAAGDKLKSYPRHENGLVLDSARTADYAIDKLESIAAFSRLRVFNGWYVKQFKKEIRAEHRAR